MTIDDRLHAAADDLLRELEFMDPPVLSGPHRRSLVLASGTALVATAAVVGLIVVATSGRPDTTVGTIAGQPIETTEDTVEPSPDVTEQRELLQLRIDQLQREVDDLTSQIEAILAQGDAGSQTELQVLQQQQSLAIRDLTDARDRLTDLDLVGADPLEQRDVLQARMDDLQNQIDDLTLQIEAILAQGAAGSVTELQVLQQQQSLTIRDLADARGRFADLDLVGASPAEQRNLLQARIDDLQHEIDDLTLQIEALSAQGADGSVTELQVLQQEQSLAIRDQADARSRLADLDLVDASSSAKRQLLLARIGQLTGQIDQLTAQINAVLAKGGDGSATDLQVLQQQQSLAIRDLADARDQFNELPPLDGTSAATTRPTGG